MIQKTFKNISIPAIGFGTYTLHKQSIQSALKLGYRHIDTAKMYGNEADVGDACKNSGIKREDLFITTKIWHDRLKPENVKKDMDDSLEKLKTDYVDLLLIHWPSSNGIPLEDTLEAFDELKEEGKTRAIGVSNFDLKLIKSAIDITDIYCNQIEYHPFLAQGDMLEICRENDIALTAYRPIAKNKVADEDVLNDLASKYNKSPAQISLRWLIQQEPVLAIPRSTKEDHMRMNLEIFDFELTQEEMKTIFSLDRGLRQIDPAFGPW